MIGAAGVAIGILLIGPRLDRWAARDDVALHLRADNLFDTTYETAFDRTGRPLDVSLGVSIGRYLPGRHNAITDVEGVRVGHSTIIQGDDIRTGVTAIIPARGNLSSLPDVRPALQIRVRLRGGGLCEVQLVRFPLLRGSEEELYARPAAESKSVAWPGRRARTTGRSRRSGG